ncbi:unnamed protein product [Medioppia subpectinata]|uniref:Uncharacterized protein n=1 Tax=Medioppia subpectinata TaxID=1979941 RepID=A0A7R9KES7_9ACAR|nr:unnamed protein product [Medioppia subpectinata]CAG2102009.1 unnamed protein product [Medioppia subpectinata]
MKIIQQIVVSTGIGPQAIIAGLRLLSLEDESFGTIPYLGTFLTDITMINTRYPSYTQCLSAFRLLKALHNGCYALELRLG